jgi:4-hydroxybenzoate polyprenyltransferase
MAKERLILLTLFVGFAALFAEERYLHSSVLHEHPFAWVPTILIPILCVACLVALAKSQSARSIALIVFALGFVAGGLGTYFHTDGFKASRFAIMMKNKVEENDNDSKAKDADKDKDRDSDKAKEESGDVPPPLAALSLSGLALVGMIVVWPGGRKRA